MKTGIREFAFAGSLLPPFTGISFFDYSGVVSGPAHQHDCYQLLLVLTGRFAFGRPDGRRLCLSSGQVGVIPPGSAHTWGSVSRGECKTLHVFCRPLSQEHHGFLGKVFPNRPGAHFWKSVPERKETTKLIARIRKECHKRDTTSSAMLYGLLMVFLSLIVDSVKDQIGNQIPEPIRIALDHIESHYADPITLDSLAHLSHLGTSRFSELFRKHMSISPMRYVNNFRMQIAESLLAYSHLTVTQIADHLGYQSIHYFSRAFSKHFGTSPSDCREQSQQG